MQETLRAAARAIADADALLIAAGAGMSVDSGLPDFRGNEGFWNAYPPLRHLGIGFQNMASPRWFERDPALAWGFYGHRLQLYRNTAPHDGFGLLLKWVQQKSLPSFVFTSNVDGHFQRAGFTEEHVVECHGSLHRLQCSRPCCDEIWSAHELDFHIDVETFRAAPPLPTCPRGDSIARPNVLMFGDAHWISDVTMQQGSRYEEWLQDVYDRRLVIIECGAGMAVPTVRRQSEAVAALTGAPLIRINPREAGGPNGTISVALGAHEALLGVSNAGIDLT